MLFWVSNLYLNSLRSAFLYQLIFSFYIWCFIGVGSFLDTPLIRVDHWQISSLLTLLIGVKFLFPFSRINKKLAAFIGVIVINLMYLLLNPLNMNVVVGYGGDYESVLGGIEYYREPTFTKFTIFNAVLAISQAVIAFITFRVLSFEERLRIIFLLSRFVKITFVIVIIEYLLKYTGNGFLYDALINTIFGFTPSGSTSDAALRGDGYLLQGLNREAAHLVVSIFTGVLILFTNCLISAKNWIDPIFILIGLTLMALSMSFTSVLSFLILSLMYGSYLLSKATKKINGTRLISSIVLFGLLAMLTSSLFSQNEYILERFDSALSDLDFIVNSYSLYSQSFTVLSSTMSRLVTVVESFNILLLRPLFGVGLGTHHAHGTTGLTLAEIGVVGFIIYLSLYFYSWRNLTHNFLYFLLVFYWIVFNIFVSIPQNVLVLRGDTIIISICLYTVVKFMNLKSTK